MSRDFIRGAEPNGSGGTKIDRAAVFTFPRLLLIMLMASLIPLLNYFEIFAPRNPLVIAGFFASAGVVCGAILLILEMYHPESRLIRVSDAPLRAAMEELARSALPGHQIRSSEDSCVAKHTLPTLRP